jgi:hypothetical protein
LPKYPSKECPNCGKWLADFQDVCLQCGAPRNLFEEEGDQDGERGADSGKKIYHSAGRTSFLIGLWLMFLPSILGTVYVFAHLHDTTLLLNIAALSLPSFYFVVLFSATSRFIRYRLHRKIKKEQKSPPKGDYHH